MKNQHKSSNTHNFYPKHYYQLFQRTNMRTSIALCALILAVCVMTGQSKPTGNTNMNLNRNKNANFDFLSSYLSSILSQQRKGKAVASRTATESAATTVSTVQLDDGIQQDVQQPTDDMFDDIQAPADENMVAEPADATFLDASASRSEPGQQNVPAILTALAPLELKFLQAIAAQDF